ncbi:hypothetical protein F7U66_01275 [Vibrio parahaemolyticus]|nr:hypothetical protein [Vibrio parahaemolyticus]
MFWCSWESNARKALLSRYDFIGPAASQIEWLGILGRIEELRVKNGVVTRKANGCLAFLAGCIGEEVDCARERVCDGRDKMHHYTLVTYGYLMLKAGLIKSESEWDIVLAGMADILNAKHHAKCVQLGADWAKALTFTERDAIWTHFLSTLLMIQEGD